MNRPTLAASATLFDRIDEQMMRLAEEDEGRAEQFCRTLAPLLGDTAPVFCNWLDRNAGRTRKGNGGRRTQQGRGCGSGRGCGCGGGGNCGSSPGRLSRTETELVKALARNVIAEHLADQLAEPRPVGLGSWPAGYMPPHTW